MCSVSSSISYILTLVDSTGMVVELKVVPSDSCIDGLCSTNIMAVDNCHRVEVWATSPFGNSSSAVDYISSKFSHLHVKIWLSGSYNMIREI